MKHAYFVTLFSMEEYCLIFGPTAPRVAGDQNLQLPKAYPAKKKKRI